jgi:hypothetical protein
VLSSRERKKRLEKKKKVAPRPPFPAVLLFRVFVIGAVSIVAAGYAIYRHYWVPRPSMLVPVPPASELPAPELEPAPR